MKNKFIAIVIVACICGLENSSAQIDIFGKVKNKINQKADQKVDQGIDKGLNKTEEEAKDAAKKKDKSGKEIPPSGGDVKATKESSPAASSKDQPTLVEYGKYDFVPGDKIIFEDHVEGETAGEFPSKWDLRSGKIEIASINGEQCIAFLEGNYASIVPLIEPAGDYLPDQFSLEFDHFVKNGGYTTMQIGFGDAKDEKNDQQGLKDLNGWITTGQNGVVGVAHGAWSHEGSYTGRWHHIALSYNKGNVKIYTDEQRLCNLPRSTGNPQRIVFGCIGGEKDPPYIKNIRIAAGGGDLYKRITTDGKIITHGILFDVNKSTIKPQSMGTLNDIVKLMKDHPELKFEVDGHTDSDGDDAANMKLSNERASAVKTQLIEMGIDGPRLTTKGFGESKPISENNSPEGKANNRRVEFVKL